MADKKQSLIKGALTGSAGILITKALGLLYVVPLNAMAGTDNMAFYSAAYTYYDLLLNICISGIPFAVATMVAKYANRNDYKTVIMIKKISKTVLTLSGIIVGLLFFLVATPLATSVMGGKNAMASDVKTLSNLYRILSLAIIAVSLLSSYRGFYQGLKEMKAYAFSQVLEQIVRISFMLSMGFILVYICGFDNISVIYMTILSASVAAICTIFYFVKFDRKHLKAVKIKASTQEFKATRSTSDLIKELYWFGIPYLIVVLLGSSMNIVNTNFFFGATKDILSNTDAKIVYGIIQVNANKLTSIPQTLALGFSAGLVPYITVAYENRDFKLLQRNILDILDTVLYICLPLSFCLLVLATEIYYVMYGYNVYGGELVAYSSLLAVTGTISPICSSLMMTLRLRKENVIYLLIGFVVKFISFFVLIKYTGYVGAITSSALCSGVIIALCLRKIKLNYRVSYSRVFRRLIVIIIGLVAMNGTFFVLKSFGLDATEGNRLLCIIYLGIYGVLGILTYVCVTGYFNLPQRIFKMTVKDMLRKLMRKIK